MTGCRDREVGVFGGWNSACPTRDDWKEVSNHTDPICGQRCEFPSVQTRCLSWASLSSYLEWVGGHAP